MSCDSWQTTIAMDNYNVFRKEEQGSAEQKPKLGESPAASLVEKMSFALHPSTHSLHLLKIFEYNSIPDLVFGAVATTTTTTAIDSLCSCTW